MSEISRRTLLGAGGTVAAATLVTTASGTADAADTAGDKGGSTPHATKKGVVAPQDVSTQTLKYEAFVLSDEGEWPAHAIFDASSDVGDMWAWVDAARTRLEHTYTNNTFTGHVQRYDQVITSIDHP